ncbi:radical SAM/SPASM domain-containing protein [Synergistales bacterium]|nr:radical SAM/SPASM domain-containing protein [Synergistales bacterium]
MEKLSKEERTNIKISEANLNKQIKAGMYPKEFTMPVGLQFELTADCNLRCRHCYNRSGDADKKTLMNVDKWVDFSKYIAAHGGVFQCILSGGEPLLLGDGIFKIMDVLHDDGTGFVLITNGYLVDEKIVERLRKYRFFWVQVSIDGSDNNFHDEFRAKAGSWEKAVRAAVMISSAGLPLTIASSVTPQNIDKIEDMADLAYSLGASTIILGEVMVSGRSYKNKDTLLSQEESVKMKQIIKKLEMRYFERMTVQTSATDVYQLNYSKTSPNTTAIIRPNGDVRLDCVAPFIGGNVLKQDFAEIWNKKLKNVWENPAVLKYAEDMTHMPDFEMDMINHVDDDIEL